VCENSGFTTFADYELSATCPLRQSDTKGGKASDFVSADRQFSEKKNLAADTGGGQIWQWYVKQVEMVA
jgi:hypothetical protein